MEGVRGLAVSSDFLAWLQAQGLSSETSCAVVNELSIKSQQALLDCTEPTTVRAELYSIAREKLPFVLYAELRRFVESRYQQLRLDPSPAPVGLPTLISVLGSLLESLSLEYSHYAHKLRSLGAEQSHNEAAVMGSEETVSSMDVKIVNVCTWNPELGRTTETENEKVQLEERRYVPSSVSVQEPSNNVIDENVIDENYQGEDWFPDSNQLEPGMLADIKVEPGIVLDVQDPELAASAFGEALGGVTNELSQRAILGFSSSVHQVSRDAFSGQGNGQQAVCHLDVESSSLTAMARMGNELDPHLGNGFEELPLVPSESTPMAHGYLRQQGKRPIGRPRKDDQLVFQDTRNWPLLCTQCGKGFASRSSLIIHMRSHTGEKPYPCKYCGRAFSSSSNLAAHEKRHMSGKMFTCRDCGKSFRTKSQLAVHCKCHFGEKRFHVRQRSRVFPTKSTLAEHKMHAPKTLNLCFICGKRVRCPSALSVHMRCHTGEKPFECKLCGRSFTLKSNLKRHHVLHCKIK